MRGKGWMVCAALAAARMVCVADYVELTATDAAGQTSFNTGLHWQGGISPADAGSAEIDFLVRGGKQVRTPDNTGGASYTFGGKSLTLGDPDNPSSKGELSFKTCNYYNSGRFGKITINDLRLYGGIIYVGTGNSYAYLLGTVNVFSKRDAPFEFNSGTKERMMNLDGKLVGEPDTGICISVGTNYVRGANANTYAGNFTVKGNTATLKVRSRDALGMIPSAFDPEAIVLDGGSLHIAEAVMTFDAADNKGLTVTENGGEIYCDITCNFNWPISGSGTLRKNGHEGMTLRLGNALSIPALVVNSGRTALANGFSMSDSSTLTLNGGRFQTASAEVEATVKNFTYNGGEIMLIASKTDSHVSCIHFEGTFTQNGKIPLSMENIPILGENDDPLIPVLTIPLDAKTVTADDFEIGRQHYGLPIEAIVVTTDETTRIQTVSLRVTPYVVGLANPSLFHTASHWSNGKVAQAGYHYLAQGRDVRQGSDGPATYEFPGQSLTLYNPDGWTNNVKSYVCKQGNLTFADLRVYDYTGISMGGGASNTPILNGLVTIQTTDPGFFRFHGGASRTGTVNATLQGEGHIKCTGEGCTHLLMADNSAFTGVVTIRCENDNGAVLNNTTTLRISDEKNLGTAPAAFTAGALTIADNGIFRPLSTVTLDDATRGITFKANGKIITDAGVTLTTQVPLTFAANAASAKDGKGTWVLGGPASAGKQTTLAVQAGAVNIQNAEALKGVALTFAADTAMTLAVPADRSDPRWSYGLLANGGLTAEGETLDVSFAFETPPKGSFTIPLCTVPEADADTLAGKIALAKNLSGYAITIERTSVEWDGTPYTCFVARFKDLSGMVITIK